MPLMVRFDNGSWINLDSGRLRSGDGTECFLDRYELQILRAMAASPNRVFDRDTIIELHWKDGEAAPLSRSVDTHIAKLRRLLPQRELIQTRRGMGYIYKGPPARQEPEEAAEKSSALRRDTAENPEAGSSNEELHSQTPKQDSRPAAADPFRLLTAQEAQQLLSELLDRAEAQGGEATLTMDVNNFILVQCLHLDLAGQQMLNQVVTSRIAKLLRRSDDWSRAMARQLQKVQCTITIRVLDQQIQQTEDRLRDAQREKDSRMEHWLTLRLQELQSLMADLLQAREAARQLDGR